jgi:hypothetical protein
MKHSIKIALSFTLVGLTGSSLLGDCKCGRPFESETTHWGGNMSVELEPKARLKIVRGRVENGGKPFRGALAEVLTMVGM